MCAGCSTEHTSEVLVTALLPLFKKRAYPSYEYVRSTTIWESRKALLEYEEALILEGRVDTTLGGQVTSENQKSASSPSVGPDPIGLNAESGISNLCGEYPQSDGMSGTPRLRNARAAKEIFESVFPRWKALVKTTTEKQRSYGLGRFESGMNKISLRFCRFTMTFCVKATSSRG